MADQTVVGKKKLDILILGQSAIDNENGDIIEVPCKIFTDEVVNSVSNV